MCVVANKLLWNNRAFSQIQIPVRILYRPLLLVQLYTNINALLNNSNLASVIKSYGKINLVFLLYVNKMPLSKDL